MDNYQRYSLEVYVSGELAVWFYEKTYEEIIRIYNKMSVSTIGYNVPRILIKKFVYDENDREVEEIILEEE